MVAGLPFEIGASTPGTGPLYLSQRPLGLANRHGLEPFPSFMQLLEGPAFDVGWSRQLDLADREFAKVGVWPLAGGETQTTSHGPRKPLVDNPDLVL